MVEKIGLLNMPREIGLKRSACSDRQRFTKYIKSLNGKSNLYTSLYSFRDKDPKASWKYDPQSAVIDRAWWDFDAGERGDIEQVKRDVATLVGRLDGDVRLVATGRGFHIHQLFKRSVMGFDFHRHLSRYQQIMSSGLKTLDGYAFPAKLTRIPNTYNATRRRWAVSIPTDAFMGDPSGFTIPKSPTKEYRIHCPFLGNDRDSDFDFPVWVANNPEQKIEMTHFKGEIGSAGEVPIMPCLAKAIEVDNPTHPVRVALVQHMAEELRWFSDPTSLSPEERDEIEDSIFDYIKSLNWRDFNPHRTRQGIRTNLDYDHSPSCRWFHLRGMCKGKCWRYDGTIGS
jgi:hypothetical protein